LKGFGCVDGEYPEKASDITPAKLEQITGISSIVYDALNIISSLIVYRQQII
jgi:hypothetical protein